MITRLTSIHKCKSAASRMRAIDKEALAGLVTSGEHGALIGKNIETIIKNKQAIENQKSLPTPDAKVIARANENITICIDCVRAHLRHLCAKPEVIEKIIQDINDYKYSQVTIDVLKLMAVRNPGMYERKYQQALQMVASKQNQR